MIALGLLEDLKFDGPIILEKGLVCILLEDSSAYGAMICSASDKYFSRTGFEVVRKLRHTNVKFLKNEEASQLHAGTFACTVPFLLYIGASSISLRGFLCFYDFSSFSL